MSKIAIVYWSGTGNTEAMAAVVAEGAQAKGAEANVIPCAAFTSDMVADYDAIAFGCPAMGAEELEDYEFEPVFAACIPELQGKPVALFGSYGWGDGEWMRLWEERCQSEGLNLASACVICCGYPDDTANDECRAMGEALA